MPKYAKVSSANSSQFLLILPRPRDEDPRTLGLCDVNAPGKGAMPCRLPRHGNFHGGDFDHRKTSTFCCNEMISNSSQKLEPSKKKKRVPTSPYHRIG